MRIYNQFRFLGIVQEDSVKKHSYKSKLKNKKIPIVNFILCVRDDGGGKNYIPITTYGKIADKANYFCRNGNKVCVVGQIKTAEHINSDTGETTYTIQFEATDVMLLLKAEKYLLTDDKFIDVLELSRVDKARTPKKSRKKDVQ